MAQPRPAEVLQALRKLGFRERPQIGDHFDLYKVVDHEDGRVTIHASLDMGRGECTKHDVDRIRDSVHLKGALWKKALEKKLPKDEYEEMLRAIPKADLPDPFWKPLVERGVDARVSERDRPSERRT